MNDPDQVINGLKEFTDNYKKYSNNKYLREAYCYKVQWKNMVCDILPGDLFAGRTVQPMIGFIPQSDEGYLGYYIHKNALDQFRKQHNLSPESEAIIGELSIFWDRENTVAKAKAAYTKEMKEALPSDSYFSESGIAFTLWRMSGVQMDYYKLMHLGIPGLKEEIISKKDKAKPNSDSWNFYHSMLIALDTFGDVCNFYAQQAKQLALSQPWNSEYNKMAEILLKLPVEKPRSFRAGLQLLFLYTVIDGARNFGRMDDALAELYCYDIDKGNISEEEAIRLLSGVWKLINERGYRYDSRIIIGGSGRNDEEKANRLALAIMETTRGVKDIMPQLALRFSISDRVLYKKALDIIAEGNPFPMLYNDDVNIPSVQKAFNVPYNEAVHAIQFGCGEYVLNHRSVGTPSGVINLLSALNVTLHKGIDPVTGKSIGMPVKKFEKYGKFESFDMLWQAYKEQIEYHVIPLALHEKLEYDSAGNEAPFLYSSMLMDDCIEKGRGIYEGGIRYLGGTLESYGNSNTADSLTAIKRLVYDEKKISLEKLVDMLDHDFEGFDRERNMLLNCPKYGNDNDIADNMLIKVHDHLCNFTRDQAEAAGLASYLVVVINNDANTVIGEHTSASSDGRKAFTYMNPGNAPVGGADKSGATAFLNSIAKPATHVHAGSVQNMKFSKEMFTQYRDKSEILLNTYWQRGGSQAMLTVINRGDLEAAMLNPELYQNLIVRVGGFSERFVNLPRHTQLEILSRTLY
ncbi:MAG TPA: pyruvate formate lyase family protein [Bacteroidales bacterium]|jgi:pyruvate-formate lyase|nr:pyruvate formate lyase family protein [Bacteroidales bacterium]